MIVAVGAAVGGVVLIVGIGIAVWWFNRGESTSADPKATTGQILSSECSGQRGMLQ
jgi:hypothetical protein